MARLEREELKMWRKEPITAEVISRMTDELNATLLGMGDGSSLGDSTDETAQVTAYNVGYVQGLKFMLEMQADKAEEEDKR